MSLGFVAASEKKVVVSDLEINIQNNDENLFLTNADVKKFFDERKDNIIGNSFGALSIPLLEKALNTHPAVENAEVSADLNGSVKVEITQRTPVLRVINKNGESYYIDSRSMLMPLSENYSARVLVATGEIFEPYSRRYQFTVKQIMKNKLFSEVSVLDDLLNVANAVNGDTILSALIQQIHVNRDRELELFPAVGNHRIVFGTGSDISEKFAKLKLFYREGLNKADAWNKYSTINLKYKNLVVCTKK
jgi:cell division protein FtsQ